MKTLSIGFIGNGKSVNRYHLPFLAVRRDRFAVRKIYSRSLQTGDWPAVEGAVYTDRLEDLLAAPCLDVIVVCTPPAYHYRYAKAAILAGKHCVVEKPFMESAAQAREIFALAEQRGVVVQCYQNRRFDSDYLTAKQVAASGRLGELLEVEMHFDYDRPEVPQRAEHFERTESFLYSHASHTLDQVIGWFGAPDRVHFDVRQLLGEGRMNDYFDLDLYYGALKVSVKSSYFRVKSRPSILLYGKKGMFLQQQKDPQEDYLKRFHLPQQEGFGLWDPQDYGVLTTAGDDGHLREERVTPVRGDYGAYYDALYDTLVHGAPRCVPPEDTILQMELLEQGIAGCR